MRYMSDWQDTVWSAAQIIFAFGDGILGSFLGSATVTLWNTRGNSDREEIIDGKRVYRCGICDEIGHNRRTCDQNETCPNCGNDDPEEIVKFEGEYRCDAC